MDASIGEPEFCHSCPHAGELRAFVVPPHGCASLLIANLKSQAYLGARCDSRIVHTPFANAVASDRGGEPRQARVCEVLQMEARRIQQAGATIVIWRCFGAELGCVESGGVEPSRTLDEAYWDAYRQLGASGLQQAYQTVARGAVDVYNARQLDSATTELHDSNSRSQPQDSDEAPALELVEEQGCWADLRLKVPDMLPIPCAYYDHDFLSQADADRLLSGLVGKDSEVVWAIGGQAAKRYTAVYCDDGLGEYAGGLGYANDIMRPWTPVLRELRDRVVQWHKQKTGRDVAFNVALLNRYDSGEHSLGYHADREEQDPSLEAPRSSPIASVSLGCERIFGFRRCQLPADLRHRQKTQAAALKSQTKFVRGSNSCNKAEARPSGGAVQQTATKAVENIPQPIEYKNDFHWEGPTRQLSRSDDTGESSHGLPTVLELAAADAADFGTKGRRSELRLGHGSLICMENACQFLYRHSLLPEPVNHSWLVSALVVAILTCFVPCNLLTPLCGTTRSDSTATDQGLGSECSPRVNLTFRSKSATYPCPLGSVLRPPTLPANIRVLQHEEVRIPKDPRNLQNGTCVLNSHLASRTAAGRNMGVFVGLMPGVHQRPRGFKDTMFHPFESPFIDDSPEVAAARYRAWLCAQPAFMRWVCAQLRGKTLLCTNNPWDIAHARGLVDIVSASESLG